MPRDPFLCFSEEPVISALCASVNFIVLKVLKITYCRTLTDRQQICLFSRPILCDLFL